MLIFYQTEHDWWRLQIGKALGVPARMSNKSPSDVWHRFIHAPKLLKLRSNYHFSWVALTCPYFLAPLGIFGMKHVFCVAFRTAALARLELQASHGCRRCGSKLRVDNVNGFPLSRPRPPTSPQRLFSSFIHVIFGNFWKYSQGVLLFEWILNRCYISLLDMKKK